MWCPVFSANPFQPEGPYCGRRHAGCSSRMESPPSHWPPATAFIPIIMMGGHRSRNGPAQCKGDINPCPRNNPAQRSRRGLQRNSRKEAHRFPAGKPLAFHSKHLPSFMKDCLSVSYPDFSDAVCLTEGLLGELFGRSATSCIEEKQREERGRKTVGKRPASQSPGPRCVKASKDCTGCAPPKTQKTSPSRQEIENGGKADPVKLPTTKQSKGEEDRSGKGADSNAASSSVWSHSLYFLRFNPSKVTAKLKDGKVHIHASHETTSGPGGSCLSKQEAKRVVELPTNVDTSTLTCTMRRDGTLVLEASITPPQDNTALTAEGKTPLPDSTTPIPGSSTPLPAVSKHPEDMTHGLGPMHRDAEMMSPLKNSSGQDLCIKQQEEEKLLKEGEHREGEEKDQEFENMEEDNEEMMEKDDESNSDASSGFHEEEDEAERITDVQREEDSDCHQLMEEDDAQSPTPAEKEDAPLRDDAQETCKSSHCTEDEEKTKDEKEADVKNREDSQQAEDADNADQHHITLAILQDPESGDEEGASHNTMLSSGSFTENLVVIHEASPSPDHTNTAEAKVSGSERSESVDQAMTEETEDGMDITQHSADKEADPTRLPVKDVTDPTRPIKCSEGAADCTQQDCEPHHSTTLDQQPQPESSDSTTTSASPHQNPPAAFRLSLPLVGFSADNVHVSLDGRTLHISASRQACAGDAPYTEHVQRELGLPAHVDPMTVRCVYLQDQGSLIITADAAIPFAQEPRTVPVVAQ